MRLFCVQTLHWPVLQGNKTCAWAKVLTLYRVSSQMDVAKHEHSSGLDRRFRSSSRSRNICKAKSETKLVDASTCRVKSEENRPKIKGALLEFRVPSHAGRLAPGPSCESNKTLLRLESSAEWLPDMTGSSAYPETMKCATPIEAQSILFHLET